LRSPEDRHRAYIEAEEKRRLGWGIYVGRIPVLSSEVAMSAEVVSVVPQLFDAQIAVLLNIPCLFAISELGGAHLPGDEDAWNTTRTSSWLAIVDEQPDHEQPVFLDVLGSLLSDAKFKKPLNDFSSALVAHTLYR
jgi:hypothetical protein